MIGRPSIFFLATTWASSSLAGCASSADQPRRETSAEPVAAGHAGGHGIVTAAGGDAPPSHVGPTAGDGGSAQSGSAAATPTAAGPVAVVILMLPGGGDANSGSAALTTSGPRPGPRPEPAPAPARTYKLLLTADSHTATIEVDGQPIGSAPVQRVYPQASPQTGATRVAAARTSLAPRLPGPRRNASAPSTQASARYAPPGSSQDPRAWSDPFPPERHESDEVPVHANTLNPNGAPIID